MNIKARILARKMVLTYLYEKYATQNIVQNKVVLKEICDIDITSSALEQKDKVDEKELVTMLSTTFPEEKYDDDITYLAKHCFEKAAEVGIDTAYVNAMLPAYDLYADKIPALIDKYTTTFWYDQMDLIDRVIFLLWYAEYKILQTPKEVILNETIELAKKYGDEWSPKLINGILHKVITAEEKDE